jgi:hypothetical protein
MFLLVAFLLIWVPILVVGGGLVAVVRIVRNRRSRR